MTTAQANDCRRRRFRQNKNLVMEKGLGEFQRGDPEGKFGGKEKEEIGERSLALSK